MTAPGSCSSDAPGTSASQALRRTRRAARSPLSVSSVEAVVDPATARRAANDRRDASLRAPGGGFEALIEQGDISVGVLLVSLLIALFWGAAHALTPGHGKALVAAYLVGTKGTPRHAFLLGGTVTIAHTAGVFAIGIVTLALSQFILPEQLYPWLTLLSGLLVVGVGAAVLRQRLRSCGRRSHGDHHHHGHDHAHDHAHATGRPSPQRRRSDLEGHLRGWDRGGSPALPVRARGPALGDRAPPRGPRARADLAFSVGLAATITAIGLVAVLARRAFGRLSLDGPLVRALPAVSAALILLVGLTITARALPGVFCDPIGRNLGCRRTRGMFGLDDWIAGFSEGASSRSSSSSVSFSASATRRIRITSPR